MTGCTSGEILSNDVGLLRSAATPRQTAADASAAMPRARPMWRACHWAEDGHAKGTSTTGVASSSDDEAEEARATGRASSW
mmetsp:Transcript_21258/g.56266  ORF Transcript_21258/g.56266 Transcript_21258/m.56266 type:complete len:81 (+) Transcript_21258:1411-1653(+)